MTSPRLFISPSDRSELATTLLDTALVGGAREFLGRPSKGLRARLIEVSYAVAGGLGKIPRAAIDMIELLHSGSLIVDDIQDGADTRRGAPALHRLLGVPRALNTGNWLYFVALTCLDDLPLDDVRARALGHATHRCLVDCHEGQALDLALKVDRIDRLEVPLVVELVSQLKTGAPMALAARLGATLAGAPAHHVETLVGFGANLGLALQMLDDLGSFVAPARHHKAIEDLRNQRVSWAWSWASEVLDPATFEELVAGLANQDGLAALRARIADAVEPIGRARVRVLLERSERELRSICSSTCVLDLVRAELARLERSYG